MRITIILSSLLLIPVASPALAYIGPGAGISVVGSLLGLLGTVLLAAGAIFLWPLRRALKKKGDVEEIEEVAVDENPEEATSNSVAAEPARKE